MKKDRDVAENSDLGERFTIVGVTPFFDGGGRVSVRVMQQRQRPRDNAFEGVIFVEVEPGPRLHQCATVALIDVVDYACWAYRVTPFVADAQIVAFPHELTVYPNEDAFNKVQEQEAVRFAAESFFPCGLFSAGNGRSGATFHDPLNDEDDFDAPSSAYFAGRVLSSEIRTNALTGQLFRTALVKTLGGTIDVVADDRLLRGELRPGNIVQGEFWLCARLIEENEMCVEPTE
jgi:hypothetical protein